MTDLRRLVVGIRTFEHSEWHRAWDIDRHRITWIAPLRGAVVALVLAAFVVGIGRPDDATPLVVGAVFAALADAGEVPGRRWRTMLSTTAWICVGAALGGVSADIGWWQFLYLPLIAWAAGFAGAAGPRAAITGVLALVVFTVSDSAPMTMHVAERNVALIGLGGLIMTLVAVVPAVIRRPSLLATAFEPGPSVLRRMRPHLHYDDDFVRHGLRLALALTIGTLIGRISGWPHEFWIPMTVAWTTRPAFDGTVSRVIQRIIGTILGIAVSVVIIEGLHLGPWGLVPLVGASTLLALVFIWANYPIAVVGITVLVISLLGMMGDPVGATAGIRILATLIACAIALLASLTWPPRPPGPPGPAPAATA